MPHNPVTLASFKAACGKPILPRHVHKAAVLGGSPCMRPQLAQGAYERGWFQSAISKPGMTASPLAVLVATAADIARGMAYLHEREAPC